MKRAKGLFLKRRLSRESWTNNRYPVLFSDAGKALSLAVKLMTEASFSPNKIEQINGRIVMAEWSGQLGKGHICRIRFESFRVVQNAGLSYIQVSACSCGNEWPFRDIIMRFVRQLRQRGWFATS